MSVYKETKNYSGSDLEGLIDQVVNRYKNVSGWIAESSGSKVIFHCPNDEAALDRMKSAIKKAENLTLAHLRR